MPTTYEPIATITFNGSTSGASFTSIPQTYTDIVAICLVRTTETVAQTGIYTAVNTFTGTTSFTWLAGDGSVALSGRGSNPQYAWLGQINGASATSGTFSTVIVHYMNYSNTTTNKTVLSRTGSAAYSTAAFVNLIQTTSALSRIDIVANNLNNFAAGSTITLYGIKAA
jgi:hypothetical protein